MTQSPLTPEDNKLLNDVFAFLGGVDDAVELRGRILDRLSPPAPEVDEATRIWREMNARGFNALADHESAKGCLIGDYDSDESAVAEISYLRQAIAELIASKDADIERWHNSYEIAFDQAMKNGSELSAMRAENERLKDTIADLEVDLDEWQRCERAAGNIPSHKAAERNPAEPPGHTDLIISPESIDAFLEANPPTDTTPGTNAGAVEVTQVDREATAKVLGYQCWADATDYRLTGEQDRQVEKFVNAFARHRTEAEARGRREALECAQYIAENVDDVTTAKALQPIIDELKRMMTGEK